MIFCFHYRWQLFPPSAGALAKWAKEAKRRKTGA